MSEFKLRQRMNKKCPTCKNTLPLNSEHWGRCASTASGFNWQCKTCARARNSGIAQKRRDARRYLKDKEKMKARERAQNFYRSQVFKCSVVGCFSDHEDLHHVDYSEPLMIVPLCKKHHRGIHHQ